MPLKVQCEHCKSRLTVRDDIAGKQVKCPKCQQAIRVPVASAASPLPADAPSTKADPSPSLSKPRPKPKLKPEPTPEPAPVNDEWESSHDEDEAFNFQDDEEESFDDPYGTPGRNLPPARKSSNRGSTVATKSTTTEKADNGPSKKMGLIASACIAGGLLCGILIGVFVFQGSTANTTASTPAIVTKSVEPSTSGLSETNNAAAVPDEKPVPVPVPVAKPIILPAPRPELTADQLAEAADVRQVLKRMLELLAAQNDREFLIQFAPIDELRLLQSSEANGQPLPEVPRDSLMKVIEAVSGEVADVGATAIVASIRVETANSGDPQWAPGPGYDGDVSAAITSAIGDLEQGKVREFMLNMFPPDALRAMFRNGPERSFAARAEKDSALVVRMLQDLKSLKAEKPQIAGDVAEFSLPAVEYTEADSRQIRPAMALYPIPDRIIRFSKINGQWRFYDDGSLRQTGALDGNVIQMNLERVGTSWRLVRYPRT